MKKITWLLAAFAFMMLIFTACNSSEKGSSDPKEVLKEFFEKLSKKDFAGAEKLATKDSKFLFNMMKQSLAMAESYNPDSLKKEDIEENWKDVEIGEAKINDNIAYVPFKKKKEDIAFDFPLKKEDGNWKVDFSFTTMMRLGMQEAKKRGIINDSTNIMDIQKKMQEGLKMRDSIIENMDPATKEKMERTLKSYDSLQKAN